MKEARLGAIAAVVFSCSFAPHTSAQDSTGASKAAIVRTTPVVRDLNEIHARIVPTVRTEGDAQILEFRIGGTRDDVYVGAICYKWLLTVGGRGRKIGKCTEDTYPNDPADRILTQNILEMARVYTGDQFRAFVKQFSQYFDKNIATSIDHESTYIYGWMTDNVIYRIPSGSTPCQISFSLQAKCGFHDANDQPVYPDTLYQGTVAGNFIFSNNSSRLTIQSSDRKEAK